MSDEPAWLRITSRVISQPSHGQPREYHASNVAPADQLGYIIDRQQQCIIRMLLKEGALFGATIGPMQTRTEPASLAAYLDRSD